ARQMGISVVCRVGPRLPHDPVLENRSALCEEAARPLSARMVHAPKRADPCLRIRAWRRKSTGARLGGVAHLQNDRAAWAAGYRLSRKCLSKTAAQLHLVGESQGRRRQ